jgi:predicted nucleic-acid-binding protein
VGRQAVKIAADTNVLVRAMVIDDVRQSRIAEQALAGADMVALSMSALCEVVWVLSAGHKRRPTDIVEALRRLIDNPSVVLNRPAAAAGLTVLEMGGDFADGVIAYDGTWLGADVFLSFDRKAVKLLEDQGISSRLLA